MRFALVRDHKVLCAFSIAYYVVLIGAAIAWGRSATPFYALFMLVVMGLVVFLYERTRISAPILWALAVWGLAHMVGGLVVIDEDIVYQATVLPGIRFDKIVHAFGFGAATGASFEILTARFGAAGKEATIAWFAALTGLGLGAINETIEFLIARYTAHSNVGGFLNTGWDLVANACGATLVAVIYLRRARSRGRVTGAG